MSTRRDPRKILHDIQQSAATLLRITAARTYAEYETDEQLRWAVERGFELCGEAMSRLRNVDPQLAESITDYRRFIGFRNILVHDYDEIHHGRTWDVLRNNLPLLHKEATELLEKLTGGN